MFSMTNKNEVLKYTYKVLIFFIFVLSFVFGVPMTSNIIKELFGETIASAFVFIYLITTIPIALYICGDD